MKFHSLATLVMLSLILVSCASNKNKNDDSKEESFKVQTPIPVSAAHVVLSFSSVSENSVTATIDNVIGYGANADRLTPGSEQEFQISAEISEALKDMVSGATFKAEIISSPMPMGNATSGWRIVKLLD